MGNVTKAREHLSVKEIDEQIKNCKEKWKIRSWMAVRHALVSPAPAKAIGLVVGLAKQTINNLISRYNKYGPDVIIKATRATRKRGNLTFAQEKELLEEFYPLAKEGKIPTAKEIQKRYQILIGKEVPHTTIYRLLDRHDWYKKVPRPFNPDAKQEEQEAFKKTSNQK